MAGAVRARNAKDLNGCGNFMPIELAGRLPTYRRFLRFAKGISESSPLRRTEGGMKRRRSRFLKEAGASRKLNGVSALEVEAERHAGLTVIIAGVAVVAVVVPHGTMVVTARGSV